MGYHKGLVSRPILHHYVPIKYQRGFCREDLVWVFDRKLNQYRRQPPKTTCVRKHYYSFEDSQGQMRVDLEIKIAEVESRTWPILEKLEARSLISLDERHILAHFMALMIGRTPAFERLHAEAGDILGKHIVKTAFSSVEEAEAIIERQRPGQTTGAKELYEFAQGNNYRVTIHRNHSLRSMLELSLGLTDDLWAMNWTVAHAGQKSSFITTDVPFVVLPPAGKNRVSTHGFGIRTPGSIKLFPISQHACLLIGGKGNSLSHFTGGANDVREINSEMAERSERFVLARDEALLRAVVARTKIDRKPPLARIQGTPKFTPPS